MLAEDFDALITFDKNLQHQQNFLKYSVTVFVLQAHINTYEVLTKLTDKVNVFLNEQQLSAGPIIISENK